VRHHVTSQRVERDHVIHHVTILGASEDYTSQCDLELSKVQHMTLKIYRDKRQIVTKSTITEGFFQGEATHVQESTISLYCMNRTSLESLFYAMKYSIYTNEMEATRSL